MRDEPVDILDANGNLTGKVLMKQEAHDRGLWHPIVHLWIYNSKGQLLLQKRSPKKVVHPKVWDISVGGHVVAGDSPKDGALKEAKEELGLKFSPSDLEFFDLRKFEEKMPDGWWNRFFAWNYIAKSDVNAAKIKFEKAEITEVRWFDTDDLVKHASDPRSKIKFPPDFKNYLDIASDEIRKRMG